MAAGAAAVSARNSGKTVTTEQSSDGTRIEKTTWFREEAAPEVTTKSWFSGFGDGLNRNAYEAVQELVKDLPAEVSTTAVAPTVSIDTSQLTNTLQTLCSTVRQQAAVIQAVEKEGTRRKMETDVAVRSLRNDVAEQIDADVRKKKIEDNQLQQLREQVTVLHGKAEMAEKERDSIVDRLRAVEQGLCSVTDEHAITRSQLVEQTKRADGLFHELEATGQRHRELQQTVEFAAQTAASRAKQLGADIETIFRLLSVTPQDAGTACARNQQCELLLQTPPFQKLSGADRELSVKMIGFTDKLQHVERDLSSTEARTTVTEEVQARASRLSAELAEASAALRQQVSLNHADAVDRARDLDARKADRGAPAPDSPLWRAADRAAAAKSAERDAALESLLRSQVAETLRTGAEGRDALARDMQGKLQEKADWDSHQQLTVTKADKEDVRDHAQKISAVESTLAALSKTVADQVHVDALCAIEATVNVLSQRIDGLHPQPPPVAIPRPPVDKLRAGTTVVVCHSFVSDGAEQGPPLQLRKGLKGVIEEIDYEGDARIKFSGFESTQWVWKVNFPKLEVLGSILGTTKTESMTVVESSAAVDKLAGRLSAIDQAIRSLKDVKVSRSELDGLLDSRRPHPPPEPPAEPAEPPPDDGAALRFHSYTRCLSCSAAQDGPRSPPPKGARLPPAPPALPRACGRPVSASRPLPSMRRRTWSDSREFALEGSEVGQEAPHQTHVRRSSAGIAGTGAGWTVGGCAGVFARPPLPHATVPT